MSSNLNSKPTAQPAPYTVRIAIEYLGRGHYSATNSTPCSPTRGRKLAARTSTPFCNSARALIALGHDPEAAFEMVRVATPDRVDMRGRLGSVATLTVIEGPRDTPHFARWRPSPFTAGVTAKLTTKETAIQ